MIKLFAFSVLALLLTACSTSGSQQLHHYLCEQHTAVQVVQVDVEQIRLRYQGQLETLNQTPAASGVRYATQDGKIVWWEKGSVATLVVDNKTIFTDCHLAL